MGCDDCYLLLQCFCLVSFVCLSLVLSLLLLLLGLSFLSVKSSYLKQVLVLVMLFLGSCIYIPLVIYLHCAEPSV